MDDGDTLWAQALDWGTELAEDHLGGPNDWDTRATAGILAIAAYALAHRHHLEGVRSLGAERLICPLTDIDDRFMTLVRAELSERLGLGHDQAVIDPADPVAAMWSWLTRTWPVDEFRMPLDTDVEYPPRYSIAGRCVPRPAVEVYMLWAGTAVDRVLRQERGAVTRNRPYVVVTGGDHDGQTGVLESPVWHLTPEADCVEPGPPRAWTVTVGPAPDHHPPPHTLRVEQIPVEHIELQDRK